jgi:hypothetical protein
MQQNKVCYFICISWHKHNQLSDCNIYEVFLRLHTIKCSTLHFYNTEVTSYCFRTLCLVVPGYTHQTNCFEDEIWMLFYSYYQQLTQLYPQIGSLYIYIYIYIYPCLLIHNLSSIILLSLIFGAILWNILSALN